MASLGGPKLSSNVVVMFDDKIVCTGPNFQLPSRVSSRDSTITFLSVVGYQLKLEISGKSYRFLPYLPPTISTTNPSQPIGNSTSPTKEKKHRTCPKLRPTNHHHEAGVYVYGIATASCASVDATRSEGTGHADADAMVLV